MTTAPALPTGAADAYRSRLGLDGGAAPTVAWLRTAHRAHLRRVPFENLDLHLQRQLSLEPAALVAKVVTGGRGGYCFELNGLFAALLRHVGFDVTLVQCRVWMDDDGDWSPPFDHLALLVVPADDDPGTAPFLADVGFGDSFRVPHRLGEQWDEGHVGRFRTVRGDGDTWLLERDRGDGWTPQYAIDPTPRGLDEFVPRCRWHETSPASPFRRRAFATLATEDGRVTIADDRLITTTGHERDERDLAVEERHAAAAARFGEAVATALDHATAGGRAATER